MSTAPESEVSYWKQRYQADQTGWDIGYPNAGLVDAVISRVSPSARILIPGAGRAYEAKALWKAGYTNTYVCDWVDEAFADLRSVGAIYDEATGKEIAVEDRLIVGDFFEIEESFSCLVEQTFFCAIPRERRPEYVERAAHLLRNGGLWIGVLFNREFNRDGPPHGGSEAEYRALFSDKFDIEVLRPFEQSIAPRLGTELFGVFQRRAQTLR